MRLLTRLSFTESPFTEPSSVPLLVFVVPFALLLAQCKRQ
jgi:hypothetical protein